VVGIRKKFFLRAFGGDPDSFVRLISMPEHYIMERDRYEEDEAREWCAGYDALSHEELDDFRARALHSRDSQLGSPFPAVEDLLTQY
jgi:phosphoglycolate phosphatase-like HAD superfamily hydrolase